MGDCTNFVIVFAGELLAKAELLLRMGLHTSEVIQGYEIAFKKALELMETIATEKVADMKNEEQLYRVVAPAIASKQYGYEDFLAKLVIKAALSVMPKNPKFFNVDNVRIVKILGSGILESQMVNGMLFNREPEGNITFAKDSKVAVFSCPLDIGRTETKATVLIHDAQEMKDFSKGEEQLLEKQFKELHDAGVNVLVTGSAIADLALHFINRYEMMVIKVLSKFDLRRLCRVTGATVLARLGVPTAEEMGHCDIVETVEIGGDRCTIFRQEKEESRTVSIVIRGGTTNALDDIERAIDDGVNVVKAVAKEQRLLPGGGASDIELARLLYSFGEVRNDFKFNSENPRPLSVCN
jgi:T-complex protein 1 subunit theta